MKKRIRNSLVLLAGGGTGGHLYPAIAIGEKIRQLKPNCDIRFVGSKKGIENTIIPQKGYVLYHLAVRGLQRTFALANFLVPVRLLWSFVQSLVLLLKCRPAAVVGTGGYVSGPILLIASALGYPTLIQEQNSYPGMTTRLLAGRVNRVHLSFADSEKYFKKKENLRITGNPVRAFESNRPKADSRIKFGLAPQKETLLVFGGSQGAMAINNAVSALLDQLMQDTDLQLLWSSGFGNSDKFLKPAEKHGSRIRIVEFIQDMESAYAAADLAVCRAGAMTLAELTLCGVPAILIPYPYAAAHHQLNNARSLEVSGAARVIKESELHPLSLYKAIVEIIADKELRAGMSRQARLAAFPNATNDIATSVLELMEQ